MILGTILSTIGQGWMCYHTKYMFLVMYVSKNCWGRLSCLNHIAHQLINPLLHPVLNLCMNLVMKECICLVHDFITWYNLGKEYSFELIYIQKHGW